MKLFGLHKNIYRASQINGEPLSKEALFRFDRVSLFISLQETGMHSIQASQKLGISRSTLFRWLKAYRLKGPRGLEPGCRKPKCFRQTKWAPDLIKKVLELRQQYPLWGKSKLAIILKREGYSASESTVGRIIKHLYLKGKLKLLTLFKKRFWRKKGFCKRPYAQRLPKGMRAKEVGEIIQIDHMTPDKLPGLHCKQFAAICPVSRYAVVEVYQNATSYTAKEFLKKVLEEMPFEVKGIQVDGGSEFKSLFEKECEARNLKLYVLPPRTPKLNGSVERSNGTWRYEFYWAYFDYLELSLTGIRKQLQTFQKIYNEYRPHQGLQGKTPLEYLKERCSQGALSVSYVLN